MRAFSTVFLLAAGVCLGLAVPCAALTYTGGDNQFAGGFSPSNAPYGGFGGGSCTATKTPVIFVPGNGDDAKNWDYPASTGVISVYDEFKAQGYNDCELFGINYLSTGERGAPQYNYHQPAKTNMIADFVVAVKAYTGKSQVDLVGHSLGVTFALEGINYRGLWSSVRRFIAISGGMRGLTNCLYVGYANPLYSVCGSQNVFNSRIFGFYPHSVSTWNPRLGDGGFRDYPSGKSTLFYSIRADIHDQILCGTASSVAGCQQSALFDSGSNVKAQLDVGHGTPAAGLDFDLTDWTMYNLAGGDADGVGHFRSKNNTGRLQYNMLSSACTTTGCCTGYAATCGN
jgi:pimeloyl-ACP methyl ester carboxylesterase